MSRQSELYRQAFNTASEIESLEGLHKDISAMFKGKGKPVPGTIVGLRTNGLKVHLPREYALKLISAEIATKRAVLAEVKRGLK